MQLILATNQWPHQANRSRQYRPILSLLSSTQPIALNQVRYPFIRIKVDIENATQNPFWHSKEGSRANPTYALIIYAKLKIVQVHLPAEETAYTEPLGNICLKCIRKLATQLGIDEMALSDLGIEMGFSDADGNC